MFICSCNFHSNCTELCVKDCECKIEFLPIFLQIYDYFSISMLFLEFTGVSNLANFEITEINNRFKRLGGEVLT